MITRLEPDDRAVTSVMGRVSPLLKLGIAVAWLVALFLTTRIGPPIALAALVLVLAIVLGRVPPARLTASLAPLWLVALTVGAFNALFGAANSDPSAAEILQIGRFRLTEPAVEAGIGLAARVLAIASVGVVFAQTTDSTRLVDSLVQQARVPERFAYGALAAYQAVPRFGEDLMTLRQARRVRGLRGEWHPRVLVGLLVLAIRHGDRLALAMDARGFGAEGRTRYRRVEWTGLDVLAVFVAIALVVVAFSVPR